MIIKAIQRAYETLEKRNWDTVYWCIDLHGTCLQSNYENGDYEFINFDAKRGLQLISSKPENVIILWSGVHEQQKKEILEFMEANDIKISYFNENPREASTKTGNFAEKFYFSILLDDKAGFDPYDDWADIAQFYLGKEYANNQYIKQRFKND